MKTVAARTLYPALGLLLVVLVTACSQTPQEQYQEAVEALQEALAERGEAREQVQEVEEEIAELRESLADATEELAQARQQVNAATQALAETVNDQVLFRAIQSALLEQSRFDETAIAVGVDNRVVTLTGSVPDEETRKAALELAQSQAGVKRVVGMLEIADQTEPTGDGGAATQQRPPEQTQPEQTPSEQASPEQAPSAQSPTTQPPSGQASPEQAPPERKPSGKEPSDKASGNAGESTAPLPE